ncbi:hypothetical protein K0I73_17135 [Shewanella mesophila]|uniref:hypothetical protein n=1 Tax=Shewanella mesophila TaxID=2864208 RepID=UPI001C65734A|nr:hypothetical protein [Shewanella mesophila]QYJ85867.1 hypothetical protein K0I73_17135 [Shewanella mesophila]
MAFSCAKSNLSVINDFFDTVINDERKAIWVSVRLKTTFQDFYLPTPQCYESAMITINYHKKYLIDSIKYPRVMNNYISIIDDFNYRFFVTDFDWIDERTPRMCFWVWTHFQVMFEKYEWKELRTTYTKIMEYRPSNHSDCKRSFILAIDSLYIQHLSTKTIIENMKDTWSFKILPNNDYKWINKDNHSQCSYIWNYLENQGLQQPYYRPLTTIDIYNSIVATFDSWIIFDDLAMNIEVNVGNTKKKLNREQVLSLIYKAWKQKIYREKQTNDKKTIKLKSKIFNSIKKEAETKNTTVESYINNLFENNFSGG